MKGRTPRLQEVAESAGVSLATASRSLSGSPGVSESVAQRVREIAQELGYVANEHARSLAAGTSRAVGLAVHEIGDPYFAEIASGVLRVAEAKGLTVQICHSGRDPERELDQIRQLVAQKVRAIIIAGSGFVDSDFQEAARVDLHGYQEAGGRVAVIGRHPFGVDSVLPDNTKGARALAEEILRLGHRRLAIVSGWRGLTTVADRLAGIEEAFGAAGLDFDAVPVIEGEFTRVGGKAVAQQVLELHPTVTAVMALNDDMAMGLLSTFRSQGVAVPQQISVSGFDDVAVAGDIAPSLTTVRLPMVEMGQRALELALQRPAARPRRRVMGYELVVRDSTAPPPA